MHAADDSFRCRNPDPCGMLGSTGALALFALHLCAEAAGSSEQVETRMTAWVTNLSM